MIKKHGQNEGGRNAVSRVLVTTMCGAKVMGYEDNFVESPINLNIVTKCDKNMTT